MRALHLLINLLLSLSVLGQTPVDQIMTKASCECSDLLLFSKNPDKNAFNKCFMKFVGNDTVLLKEECKKIYGDNNDETFYKFGEAFMQRNSVDLVFTCDKYFKAIDSGRYLQINSLNKDSIRSGIEFLNSTDSTTWDKSFYMGRGLYYFALSDYNHALHDLEASLLIDTSAYQSLFFKAWILEIQERYDEAIKIYSDLALATKTHEYNIFAAVAKRKKNHL